MLVQLLSFVYLDFVQHFNIQNIALIVQPVLSLLIFLCTIFILICHHLPNLSLCLLFTDHLFLIIIVTVILIIIIFYVTKCKHNVYCMNMDSMVYFQIIFRGLFMRIMVQMSGWKDHFSSVHTDVASPPAAKRPRKGKPNSDVAVSAHAKQRSSRGLSCYFFSIHK